MSNNSNYKGSYAHQLPSFNNHSSRNIPNFTQPPPIFKPYKPQNNGGQSSCSDDSSFKPLLKPPPFPPPSIWINQNEKISPSDSGGINKLQNLPQFSNNQSFNQRHALNSHNLNAPALNSINMPVYKNYGGASIVPVYNRSACSQIEEIDFSQPPPNLSSKVIAPGMGDTSQGNFEWRDERFCTTAVQNINNDVSSISGEEDWVKRWKQSFEVGRSLKTEGSKLKISDFQHALVRWSSLLTRFAQIHSSLKSGSLEPDMERTLLKGIQLLKADITDASFFITNPSNLSHFKSLIEERRSKRLRERVSKKRKRVQQREMKVKWEKKECEIDEWRNCLIKKEKDKVEGDRLSSDADSILSEVRAKITEATQMSLLLKNLSDLRAARVKKGIDHGYNTNPSADRYFDNINGKLQSTIKNQLDQYKLEEQTLQIMIDHAHARSKLCDSVTKVSVGVESAEEIVAKRSTEIRNILFGSEKDVSDDYIKSREQLVQRRCEWDEFLVMSSDEGSSIPPSWVVPPTSPSDDWKKYKLS